jgi:SNF2 family DNA or RNA helicase
MGQSGSDILLARRSLLGSLRGGMHILHGTWLYGRQRFALWGEDTTISPRLRRGRRSQVARHPSLINTKALLRHLDRYTTDVTPKTSSTRDEPVNCWLPGVGKRPCPSPEALGAGMVMPEGEPELLCWSMDDAILLSPIDVLDYLVQLPLPHEVPPGFIVGSDLCFWQQAAMLAMNCLVEQRYIPALEQAGTRLLAFWQPEPDVDLLAQMSANMPPVCRAAATTPADAPQPDDLLANFLRTIVDTFVREELPDRRRSSHRWLKALSGSTTQVSGSPADNRALYDAWQRWQEAATGGAMGTFRVCFRLDEPAVGDAWTLRYLLQATDDPGVLVEAETVWAAKGRTLHALERRFDDPQEKLLAALGLASRVYPPIERSLHESSPTGVILSHDEAYAFLVEALPLLEASRFSVLVPNWWKRAARLKAKVKVEAQESISGGILGRDALLRYRWEMSLGGQTISQAEFEELVALKQPMVRFKGEWVTLDPKQIEAALKFFEQETGEGEIDLLDALKLSAGDAERELEGLEVEEVAFEDDLDAVLSKLRDPATVDPPRVPESLHATLRPYQQRGFGWLAQMRQIGLGACLADDMGLGKTPQTITLWLHERENLAVDQPALLVCPTSVVGNWRHEVNRFAPSLRVMTHQGPTRLQGEAFAQAVEDVDIVLTSYALLARDRDTLSAVHWSDIVLDEAQNIKNPSTKQAQAARSLSAEHRLALTGTPVENRLSELWSILHFLNPGYLGSRQAFRSQFGIPIERYGDEAATTTLRRLTAPFILRRVKTDPNVIADLPDKFESKVYCTLTAEQATLYEAVVREEMEALESADDAMARRGAVLRMLTRLKQICNHPAHFIQEAGGHGNGSITAEHSGKLARLTEMLDEALAENNRALIFTQYAQMGGLLQPYLQERIGAEVLYLHGGTSVKKREEMIARFQAEQGPPLFILSLKAGGTGLNLTRANHVFHYDRWYNPAVENQATDRAFRIGQTRTVQVHKFICLGTLEERIDELIEHKQALAESIVGKGENWISEMSTDDIRGLVSLRREVIEEG